MIDTIAVNIELGKIQGNKSSKVAKYSYKMLEEINNGIKYFGGEEYTERGIKAKCICPECGEIWKPILSDVRNGKIKRCCRKSVA